MLLLGGSETFLSFQTSGLESSLSHLLLAGVVLSAGRRRHARDWLVTALLCSLLLVNRQDQVFLILPLAVWALLRNPARWRRKIVATLAGALPLLAWEVFSLVYYGFPFPNTRYAKLGARDLFESLHYGVHYVADFGLFEPLQLIAMLALPGYLVIRHVGRRERLAALGLGILLQLLFVVSIGGDFMRGRFLLSSLVATALALLLLCRRGGSWNLDTPRRLAAIGVSLLCTLYGRAVVSRSVPLEHVTIHNERIYYADYLALDWANPGRYREHPWAVRGRMLDAEHARTGRGIPETNGQLGYNVRSSAVLIDLLGLTDAFVARCPVTDASRSGHFQREIPEEYLRERVLGVRVDGWRDPELETLWRDLQLIISSDELFSAERFRAMGRVWRERGI